MDMQFNDSRTFGTNDSAQELRPLGWSELCARLAAAQDLRRSGGPGIGMEVGPVADANGRWGSFHHPAALMLLHDQPLPEWGSPEQVEHGVNPVCSRDGNDGGGTPVDIKTTSPNSSGAEPIRRELP